MEKIIRKLGAKERIRVEIGKVFLLNCELKSSSIDLFTNLELTKRAVRLWIDLYPMLRVKVVKPDVDKQDLYFAWQDEDVFNDLTNVQFIKCKKNSYSQKAYDLLNELLCDKFLTDAINPYTERLWTIKFVEINPPGKPADEHRYSIIMGFQHCIADGISGYDSLLKLLNVIEDHHKNKDDIQLSIRNNTILPSLEDMFYKQLNNYSPIDVPRIYWPKFANPDRAKQSTFNSTHFEPLLAEMKDDYLYLADTSERCLEIEQAVLENRNYCSKSKRLVIDEEKYLKLKSLCKRHQVTMTSCFHMISSLALKMLYKEHGNEPLDSIVYMSALSMRQFEPDCGEKIGAEPLGYYTGGSLNRTDLPGDLNAQWPDEFWPICKRENDSFHQRIGEEKQRFYNVPYVENETEMTFHFLMSSMGLLKSSLEPNASIQVTSVYVNANLLAKHKERVCVHLISTVGNKIFWSLEHNAHFIDEIYVNEITSHINSIIETLTNKLD